MSVSLAKDQDKFVLRLPEGMRERIKKSADRNNRSMNAEIISALQAAYPEEDFVISSFWEHYGQPILSAETDEQKWKLLDRANAFLDHQSAGLYLSPIVGKDGHQALTFVGLERYLDEKKPEFRRAYPGTSTK